MEVAVVMLESIKSKHSVWLVHQKPQNSKVAFCASAQSVTEGTGGGAKTNDQDVGEGVGSWRGGGGGPQAPGKL